MVDCGHSVTNATLGIQWHVLGMFAPSFFTGSLILRFGVCADHRARACRCSLVSAVVGLAGISRSRISGSRLTLLGVGWNFAFIGATTMVTALPSPGGAQQGPGVQRFPDLRHHGDRLVRLRHDAGARSAGPSVNAVCSRRAGGRARCWPGSRCAQRGAAGLKYWQRVFPAFRADPAISRRCVGGRFLAYPRHIQPGRGPCLGSAPLQNRGFP